MYNKQNCRAAFIEYKKPNMTCIHSIILIRFSTTFLGPSWSLLQCH